MTPQRRFDPHYPRTLNPYVPWVDPTLLLLAPLMMWATLKGDKRRRRCKRWLSLLLLGAAMVTLAGCPPPPERTPTSEPSRPVQPPQPPSPSPGPPIDTPPAQTPSPAPTPPTKPLPTPTPNQCLEVYIPDNNIWISQEELNQVLSEYTEDEKRLARGIWNEQRNQGHEAMEAAAWVLKNNVDLGKNLENVLKGMLENWPGTDPVSALSLSPPDQCEYCREEGLGSFSNNEDTRRYFDALKIARNVLNGCGSDITEGATHFVNFNGLDRGGWNLPEGWNTSNFEAFFSKFGEMYSTLDLWNKKPSFSYKQFGVDLFVFNDWNVMRYGYDNNWQFPRSIKPTYRCFLERY